MPSLLESRVIESCSEDPSNILALQLRIARRADELVRARNRPARPYTDTEVWMEAELDILSTGFARIEKSASLVGS